MQQPKPTVGQIWEARGYELAGKFVRRFVLIVVVLDNQAMHVRCTPDGAPWLVPAVGHLKARKPRRDWAKFGRFHGREKSGFRFVKMATISPWW